MPFYKILTNRFAEWKYGDVAALDDAAARVSLEKGEIVLVGEEKKEEEKPPVVEEKKEDIFVCELCGKVCKKKIGLLSHMKSHQKSTRLSAVLTTHQEQT